MVTKLMDPDIITIYKGKGQGINPDLAGLE